AAEQRLKHGLYIVDALMYATALRFNSKLLTGDRHFQKLENAEFMEK
ncbi:PIN domain-containing protein, partial [Candidatus Woesearchaeota archaeon]|nr:PIN domain-containing protein [Candidatus Woesearchaeota archaeon]